MEDDYGSFDLFLYLYVNVPSTMFIRILNHAALSWKPLVECKISFVAPPNVLTIIEHLRDSLCMSFDLR
jgi:hypothetical protein